MSKRILIVAADGCAATGLMAIRDLFLIANRISQRISRSDTAAPLFEVGLYSLDGGEVVCGNGCRLSVDGPLPALTGVEVVVSPAFMVAGARELDATLEQVRALEKWLREQGGKAELLLSNCSGTFLIAEAGLLDGGMATTAWWLHDLLRERYPQVQVETEAVVVRSGRVLTGAATSSLYDVGLAVIEQYAGKAFARLVAKYMMLDNQRRSQAAYTILSQYDSDDPLVEKAELWIRRHISEDFRVEQLAEAMAVSPRTLIRRFQKAVGESPQGFAQRLRVEKSKILLETTQLRFSEIVQRCGYNDESAFRRLFKRYCQLSPREYRQRFNSSQRAPAAS